MVMPPTIEVANIGMADSLILMVMALVVFGPRRLPQIGRQIGKLMYEFRKASNDFKFQMEEELRSSEDADRRKKEEERLRELAAAAPAAATAEVSQASEAGVTAAAETQAPVPDGQFPTPSPYPGEEVYPPVIEPAATELPEATAQVQPVIQPPSTGEQVAAARPTSLPPEPVSLEPEIELPAPSVQETTPTAAELAYAEEKATLQAEAEAKLRAEAEAAAGAIPQQAEKTPTKPVKQNA
jgi:sec-independent protein translocase protein TatB